jgi:hypothetical protein
MCFRPFNKGWVLQILQQSIFSSFELLLISNLNLHDTEINYPSSIFGEQWARSFLVSVNALNIHVPFLGSFSSRSATKKNAKLDISKPLKGLKHCITE